MQNMKDEIRIHLNDPRQLEKLYRANKTPFKKAFSLLYPELKGNAAADFWNERLHYETDDIKWGTRNELVFVIIAALFAGAIAKLPHFFGMDEEFFYPRNIGFIVFPALTAYFAWRNKLSAGKMAVIAAATLAGLVFINALPNVKTSDTLVLSCVHLLLVLWAILGFAFMGDARNIDDKRLAYLKFNGDLVVMTTLILIAGGIMTGLTLGLFELIGFRIEEFYFKNVVVFGLPAAPIVGSFLIQTNPQLVGKVSPVIAKIFSPLVLLMLVIYLGAIFYSGKDPYNDREFLLIFNGLLIGVMALIFFSVSDASRATKSRAETWVLFLLSVVTIVVNGIALSAILFRISEWGLTPNRAAVLGSNLIILVNLLLVTAKLYKVIANRAEIDGVSRVMALYLPVYVLWAAIVTFIFPLIFGFK
jgi:hypothetical protein